MKKIVLILLVISSGLLMAKGITTGLNLDLDNYYTNNVLKLSDYDLDRFESGEYKDKFELETSDDFITSLELGFWGKYKVLKHTNQTSVGFKFDKYWKNDFKDEARFEVKTKQFISKSVNLELGYMYYPEIYVNRYSSVLDDSGDYHDFTYSKNQYNLRLFWKPLSKLALIYRFEAAQLFYDEYFTEYDADNLSHSITTDFSPLKSVKLTAGYGFKDSNAEAGDAFAYPENIEVIKDGSYEANIYSAGITLPHFISINDLRFAASFRIRVEDRFFDSLDLVDTYHVNREDQTISYKASLRVKASKDIDIKPYWEYIERETESPFAEVTRDKSYSRNDLGITVSWDVF